MPRVEQQQTIMCTYWSIFQSPQCPE